MNINMLDLPTQFQKIKGEVMAEVAGVFETQYFVLGPRVKKLEEQMAALAGMPFGIGVSSGSDALILSLLAIGIKPGDEVVTTPYTFFATTSAIVRVGGRPVFADVHPETYNLSVQEADEAITPRTRALLPVHLFGLVADPVQWQGLAKRHGLYLIEDACQAVGAKRAGFTAGGIGDLSTFSFYPTKNLGGAGDGGMVLARDVHLADLVRKDRVHGGHDRYFHDRVGICGRLDELQAAVLLVKFKYLHEWNEHRRKIAALYDRLLTSTPVITPKVPGDVYHTYHQYVILGPRRDALRDFLKARGIGCDIYYPLPLHLQECFASLGYKRGQFPVAERLAEESLALPINAEITEVQVETVTRAVRDFYGGAGA
jgi:dTDP-4-amino-4,6-dideoxygalactose transaminase